MIKNKLKLFTCLTACYLITSPFSFAAEKTHLVSEQTDATSYAKTIDDAFGQLNYYIRRTSTSGVDWSPLSIPPASSGWKDDWTKLGLRARYCQNSLIVYVEPANLKGIAGDQRQVQVAPLSEMKGTSATNNQRLDFLLSSGSIRKGDGKTLTIPACLNDKFETPLPANRVALFGPVIDPGQDTTVLIDWLEATNSCPAGTHGSGVRSRQKTVKTVDGRGNIVNSAMSSWEEVASFCQADFTYWDYFQKACSWYEGPPHNKQMSGITTYKIMASVTQDGIGYGTPQFVSSTCFNSADDDPEDIPEPSVNVATSTDTGTKTEACGSGYSGSKTETRARTVQTKTITFPWNQAPLSAVNYGPWSAWAVTSSNCHAVSSGGNGGGHESYTDTTGDGWGDTPTDAVGDDQHSYGTGHGFGSPAGNGTSDQTGSTGGTSDGGSSSRVICTELMYEGLLSREDWALDCRHSLKCLSATTRRGYHYWASRVVTHHMRDQNGIPRTDAVGRLSYKVWTLIAQSRANQIRFVMKRRFPAQYGRLQKADKRDLTGMALRGVLEGFSWCVGKWVGEQDVSRIHNNPYRQPKAADTPLTFGYVWGPAV